MDGADSQDDKEVTESLTGFSPGQLCIMDICFSEFC